MKIDLFKPAFYPDEIKFIIGKLRKASEIGYLQRRTENNQYLMASFMGVEEYGISPKWNVKIYTYSAKKHGHSLVCVDRHVLRLLVKEDYDSFIPPDLKLIRIDDAGWGFPLCGVMVGVSDEKDVLTAVVPVEYFRDGVFQTKRYLKIYSDLAVQLLDEFGASPGTHRIEICTGYVNQPLRERLRGRGYDVRVVEIKGMLQERLECLFKQYVVETVGSDIYYDPKDMIKTAIPRRYKECLKFGKKHCPHLLKTGWSAISA